MFANEKKTCLAKLDRSNKGKIDSKINRLVLVINCLPDYYTTSSCSGRITLLRPQKFRKHKTLFNTHEQVEPEQIIGFLKEGEQVWFRQEPLILHIACRNIPAARKILEIAHNNGFKRAGIVSLKKNLVEIRSDEIINALVADNGYCIDDKILLKLINEANFKKILIK